MNKVRKFVKAVLEKAGIKYTYYGVVDYDLRRIWLDVDNTEYTIRIWNVTEDSIEYTLFRHDGDKAVEIGKGVEKV